MLLHLEGNSGRKLLIPAAGTGMMALTAVPLCKDPGTKEEET